MSLGEIVLRLLAEMKPLLPGVITTVVTTVVAMLCLYFSGRHAWLKSKKFPLPSLFFGLGYLGMFRISCAWIKLIFPIVYIVSFQKLVLIQYVVVLIPGVILAVLLKRPGKIVTALMNLLLELAGIISASLICGYIIEMRAGSGFMLIYVAIGIFLSLFVIYLFLQDIESISAARKINADEIWRIAGNEEK